MYQGFIYQPGTISSAYNKTRGLYVQQQVQAPIIRIPFQIPQQIIVTKNLDYPLLQSPKILLSYKTQQNSYLKKQQRYQCGLKVINEQAHISDYTNEINSDCQNRESILQNYPGSLNIGGTPNILQTQKLESLLIKLPFQTYQVSNENLKTDCQMEIYESNQAFDLSFQEELNDVSVEVDNQKKRKVKKWYDYLVVANTCKGHSHQDPSGSLRSDVLYKTIIRDMRKFYSVDFNDLTRYIKRKRYRGNDYFSRCLDYYLSLKFPQLYTSLNGPYCNKSQDLGTPEPNTEIFTDQIEQLLFLGCLIYPKDIKITTPHLNLFRPREQAAHFPRTLKPDSLKYNILHTYMYSFSLEKLNMLVNLDFFAFFYVHYFQEKIVKQNRIQNKDSMKKHQEQYIDACNLILRLCQKSLSKKLAKMVDQGYSQVALEEMKNIIKMEEIPKHHQTQQNLNLNQDLKMDDALEYVQTDNFQQVQMTESMHDTLQNMEFIQEKFS
eukprot:403335800